MNQSIPSGPPAVLELPNRLDAASCKTFVETLSQCRGQDVALSSEALEFLGAFGAEVLLRAGAEWRETGRSFVLRNPSQALLKGLDELGIPATELTMETTT